MFAVRGFWHQNRRTIFDVRVIDTDNISQRSRKVASVLASRENETKVKYLKACLETQQDLYFINFLSEWSKGHQSDSSQQAVYLAPIEAVDPRLLPSVQIRPLTPLYCLCEVSEYVFEGEQEPYLDQVPLYVGQWYWDGAI